MNPCPFLNTSLAFRRYNSISNMESGADLRKMELENHFADEVEWVMTEKSTFLQSIHLFFILLVHGANFSLLCNGSSVVFAKRTTLLGEGTTFYDFESLKPSLKRDAFRAYELVSLKLPQVKSVVIYGELFGGIYQHHDVSKNPEVKHIQKGVFYSPDLQYILIILLIDDLNNSFYAFDLWVKAEKNFYADFDFFEGICKEIGLLYSEPIARGGFLDFVSQTPNLRALCKFERF